MICKRNVRIAFPTARMFRRTFLFLVPFTVLWTHGPAQAADLLDRAIALAGGEARLANVRNLHWTGTATIFAGNRQIEIGTATTVRPWLGARSDTWLRSDGPAKTRSLIVEGTQGWTEMEGVRKPLPPAQAKNEALQYSLYALMLLTPLRDHQARLASDDAKGEIAVTHPDAPPTVLLFDKEAHLIGARNIVPAPDAGAAPIHQDIRFSGDMTSKGVHWPKRIDIDQDGKPFFTLLLDSFEAR
jgi:hypothetical protein